MTFCESPKADTNLTSLMCYVDIPEEQMWDAFGIPHVSHGEKGYTSEWVFSDGEVVYTVYYRHDQARIGGKSDKLLGRFKAWLKEKIDDSKCD